MDPIASYTVSIDYDSRLYRQDIAGSIAHARMLAAQGIIAPEEAGAIVRGCGRYAARSKAIRSRGGPNSKTST